ncbi:hypothetical protein [Rossellomorea marisflavi]|uniref:hypothetical protein n=1 Tax=Rossellomorea TaxID=2837508 RepID=UPI00064E7FEF|nr:hypothetical protein [Rossellomorea marisflavi]VXC41271.1 conserved hypothetical protein [Bacillus sp. 349Y]KMK91749.1 hypothetical protein VL03_17410 [Rossellomorea marisflavi]KML04987.1 hypothetical protein VL06_11635 [Rossellomorea marisflavi]KML35127.1 hypothetical protein VL12_02920 [Rossellomorea marisflavi]QHA37343.1 hypothetical protein D5E69_17185 [Rossellomorea marisflavi]
MLLLPIGQAISFIMAVYLFSYSYIQALKISESAGIKLGSALTFIFSSTMAVIFSGLTYTFS